MRQKHESGYSLLELMIAVTILGFLAVIATPHYLKARQESHKSTCMANMKRIEEAKELYAFNGGTKVTVEWSDILPYLKSQPNCPTGGTYANLVVGSPVYCTVHDWRDNPEYKGFVP